MSEISLCRCCGQPLPPKEREGVWLPAKKAEIFDFVDRHPGITAQGILAQCFTNGATVNLVRQHIHQINNMLAATNVSICGDGKDGKGPWVRGEYRIIRA